MYNFFSYMTFMNLCSMQRMNTDKISSTTRDHHHSQFLYVPHNFCISFEQISTVTSVLHLFSRIITDVFNNFYHTVLVFWLHQAIKFFIYCVLVIKTVMGFNPQLEFCTSETSHLCSLSKKTKAPDFCFVI